MQALLLESPDTCPLGILINLDQKWIIIDLNGPKIYVSDRELPIQILGEFMKRIIELFEHDENCRTYEIFIEQVPIKEI